MRKCNNDLHQGSFHINSSNITGHHHSLTKYLKDELIYFVCYNFSLRLHRIPGVFHVQRNPWVFQLCGHPVKRLVPHSLKNCWFLFKRPISPVLLQVTLRPSDNLWWLLQQDLTDWMFFQSPNQLDLELDRQSAGSLTGTSHQQHMTSDTVKHYIFAAS